MTHRGKPTISRRGFLGGTLAAAAISIVPRHVLGGPGHIAPSEKITHAVIGCGGIFGSHIGHIRGFGKSAHLISVCDVDAGRMAKRIGQNKSYNPKGYHDFRDMLAKEDIDICHVATPPHWHGLMGIAAAEAGCDVWGEKPMTRTIGESEALRRAIQANGRVFRLNTWFRFRSNMYGMKVPAKPLKKLVMSGALGGPVTARLSRHTGFTFKSGWQGKTNLTPQPIPNGFDYDLWQGPAHEMPYNRHRTHGTFRGYWPYDSGGLGDMCQHYIDPVQYILGKDHTSPVSIETHGRWPQHPDAVRPWGAVTMTYADGTKIILESDDSKEGITKGKPFLEGPDGKVYRGFKTDPVDLATMVDSLPDPEPMITDFHETFRTRKPFALNEQNGHRSNILVHLADIAIRIPRKLTFDPDKLLFVNDDEANRLIHQPMRAPWRLPQY